MKQLLMLTSIVLLGFFSLSQESPQILTYEEYIQQVMENHPSAFRASITQSMGKSQLLQSRGAFDPKLVGNIDQKYFDDKQYYSHAQGALKIPTWFGISAEAGYQMTDGVYLNPEQRLPEAGLWYAGLRLELGNGLIIDQRRAEFEKAKLLNNSSKLERKIQLNKLRRDASVAYWKWQQAYKNLSIYQLAYDNASQRLNAVKESSFFGDRPYIDTVEASMSLQNRQVELLKAQTTFTNAEIKLEIYLWADGFIPLEIENSIPETSDPQPTSLPLSDLDSIVVNHPYLKLNELQLAQNKIDLQLKREQLKPRLTLKYNALSEPINGDLIQDYSVANYNWGATFAYPILSRKERGGLQLAKLKMSDQEMKNKVNAVEINYLIQSSLNEYQLAFDQLTVMRDFVSNNQRMYDAERSLFQLGESSVFMINTRENAWLKARIQLIESEVKCNILKAELDFELMRFDQ